MGLILGILVLFVKQLYLQCVLGVKRMKSACEDSVSKLFFLFFFFYHTRQIRKSAEGHQSSVRGAQAYQDSAASRTSGSPKRISCLF